MDWSILLWIFSLAWNLVGNKVFAQIPHTIQCGNNKYWCHLGDICTIRRYRKKVLPPGIFVLPPDLKADILLADNIENNTSNDLLHGIDVHNMVLKFHPKFALSWQDHRVIFPGIRSGEQKALNGQASGSIWIPKITVTGLKGDQTGHEEARK